MGIERWNKGKVIVFAIALKVIYYIFFYFLPHPQHDRFDHQWFGQHFISSYGNNDSGWYLEIVENGYQPGSDTELSRSLAFFPVYPFTARLLQWTLPIDATLSLFIVASVFSILAFLMFHQLVLSLTRDADVAMISTVCLMIFPHHYYFSMMYTESMFLFFLVAAYYSILKERWAGLIVSSILLVLTRINGVVLLLPLFLFTYEIMARSARPLLQRALRFLPACTAFTGYCIHLYFRTNDLLAFKTAAEAGWGSNYSFPLTTLINTWLVDAPWHLRYNAIYAAIFLGLSCLFLRKRQYSFFTLAVIGICFPLIEGSTVSQPRFISVLFPFSLLLGTFIASSRYRYIILSVLFILQLVTLRFWAVTHPFSY